MKKMMILFAAFISMNTFAQFKEPGFSNETVRNGIIDQSSGSLFGFLDSDNFVMRHSNQITDQGHTLGLQPVPRYRYYYHNVP